MFSIPYFRKKYPIYEFSSGKIMELYDKEEITEEEVKEYFLELYFTGMNRESELVTLFQKKGMSGEIDVSFDGGVLVMPFLEASVALNVSGSVAKTIGAVNIRNNDIIDSEEPFTFGLYPMKGYSGSAKGGVTFKAGIDLVPGVAATALEKFEYASLALNAEASLSASVEGEWRRTKTKGAWFAPSIADRELSNKLYDFVTGKIRARPEEPVFEPTCEVSVWRAQPQVNAHAGVEFSASVNLDQVASAGVDASIQGDITASVAYTESRVQTTDNAKMASVLDTKITFKKVGADVALDGSLKASLAGNVPVVSQSLINNAKEFLFVNSTSYESSYVHWAPEQGEIVHDRCFYLKGTSLVMPNWQKFFTDDYLEYAANPDMSPYIQSLSRFFGVSHKVLWDFIVNSAGVVNDVFADPEINPTALFIDAVYSPGSDLRSVTLKPKQNFSSSQVFPAIKGTAVGDDRLKTLRISYRLQDSLDNGSTIIAPNGINLGVAQFNISLNKLSFSEFSQMITLYDVNADESLPVNALVY